MTDTIKAYIAAALMAVAFGAGWMVNGWRSGIELANFKAAETTSILAVTRAAEERATKLADDQAAIDAKHTKELQEAKDETTRIRTGVANGTIGLRIAATCPAATGPTAPGSAGVGDGASPRLTATAEQDYYTLRDAIVTVQKQLAEAQDILASRK